MHLQVTQLGCNRSVLSVGLANFSYGFDRLSYRMRRTWYGDESGEDEGDTYEAVKCFSENQEYQMTPTAGLCECLLSRQIRHLENRLMPLG